MQLPAIANSAQRLPAIAPRPEPVCQNEAQAMRQLWRSALVAILEEFETDERAREYLQSRDGRMVLEMAGIEQPKLDRLNLKATYLLSKEEQRTKAKESARELDKKRKHDRELKQARLKQQKIEAAERKEAKQRIAEKHRRIREIDRRVAQQKAAQEAQKPSGQLFMIDPGRPIEQPTLPAPNGPRPESLSGRIWAECDRLLAAGAMPTNTLLIAAFPGENGTTLSTQKTRWASACRAAGIALPTRSGPGRRPRAELENAAISIAAE